GGSARRGAVAEVGALRAPAPENRPSPAASNTSTGRSSRWTIHELATKTVPAPAGGTTRYQGSLKAIPGAAERRARVPLPPEVHSRCRSEDRLPHQSASECGDEAQRDHSDHVVSLAHREQ